LCRINFHYKRKVEHMNLVESIERRLKWLASPHYLQARLDMETRPIQQMRLELEIVYCTISRGETMLKFPVTMLVLPTGSSPIRN
jgi:hypothetical protein